jgi:hypothetical protein
MCFAGGEEETWEWTSRAENRWASRDQNRPREQWRSGKVLRCLGIPGYSGVFQGLPGGTASISRVAESTILKRLLPSDRACGDRRCGLPWKSTSATKMTMGAVYF